MTSKSNDRSPSYRLHGCCVSARSQKLASAKPYVASPHSINLPADSLISADRRENRQTTVFADSSSTARPPNKPGITTSFYGVGTSPWPSGLSATLHQLTQVLDLEPTLHNLPMGPPQNKSTYRCFSDIVFVLFFMILRLFHTHRRRVKSRRYASLSVSRYSTTRINSFNNAWEASTFHS